MEAKSKERTSELEENAHLCVSPRVVEVIPPEDVSVAVMRHLRRIEAARLTLQESDTDHRCRYGRRRSVHQSLGGIEFQVSSDLQDLFIDVTLPDEE